MDVLAESGAALLTAVFAVSGAAKLLDPSGTRAAVEALGVPPRFAGAVSTALAPVELTLALLLLLPPTGPPAAAAAVVLLLGFTVVVAANLLIGRRARCGCFAGLGAGEVSRWALVRNLLLVAAAVAALGPRTGISAAGVAVGLLLAGLVLAGERAAARVSARADTDQEGAALDGARPLAPSFALPSAGGGRTTLGVLLALGRPVFLVFLAPSCGACTMLLPSLVRWQERFEDRLTVVAVGRGTGGAVRSSFGAIAPVPLLLSHDDAVARQYGIVGSPSAALIGTDGRLDAPVAFGTAAVRRLLGQALSHDRLPLQVVSPDDLHLGARPLPVPTVTRSDDGGRVLLVDEATGAALRLDALGGLVWQCLDGRTTVADLAADLAAVFDATLDVVTDDVVDVLRSCAAAGLVAVRPAHVSVP